MDDTRWIPLSHSRPGVEGFGGKFGWLQRLVGIEGVNVPPAVGLSSSLVDKVCTNPSVLDEVIENEIIPHLYQADGGDWNNRYDGVLAVRSSGNVEDGTEYGFPGVFRTVLNVQPNVRSIRKAIKKVHKSKAKERVSAFCAVAGIDPASIKMSCVIQWQVKCRISGVCMTSTNPEVRDEFALLNFAKGECSSVVDGKPAETVVIDKWGRVVVWADTLAEEGSNIDRLASPFWNCEESFEEFQATLQEKGDAWDIEELLSVFDLCRLIEDAVLRPMDIEWGIDPSGKKYIFQARPINHRNAVPAVPGT